MSGSLSSGADIFLNFFQLDSSTGTAEGTATSASGVGDACGADGEPFFLEVEFL
jgi:hypothetical protein